MRKIVIQSFKILFSAGIIFWLVQSGKIDFTGLRNILEFPTLFICLGLIATGIFFSSERWRLLIQSQGIQAHRRTTMKLTLIGSFFNFAMPGGVGGDVLKAYYFTSEFPGQKVIAVTSVLMDRILGLFSMILLALLVMVYNLEHVQTEPTLMNLFWFIVALFLAAGVGLSLLFSQKLYSTGLLKKLIGKIPFSKKLLKLYESAHLYGKDGRRVLLAILISLVGQASSILFLYMAGQAAGFSEVSLKTYWLVAPLGFMATAIPISPAGVGVGQAAFYFLFNLYTGTQTEVGPTTITAFQVGTFVMSLSGAYFYLRHKPNMAALQTDQFKA